MQHLRRLTPAVALAALATAVALASSWHSGERMWRALGEQRRVYSGYTETERRHAAIDTMGLPSDIFDFYREYVHRGDRIYFQVQESGFSSFVDIPTAVRYVGRYYLLPAREARSLEDATVVVSYYADPNLLGVEYVTQQQAGLQPIFVSRITSP